MRGGEKKRDMNRNTEREWAHRQKNYERQRQRILEQRWREKECKRIREGENKNWFIGKVEEKMCEYGMKIAKLGQLNRLCEKRKKKEEKHNTYGPWIPTMNYEEFAIWCKSTAFHSHIIELLA